MSAVVMRHDVTKLFAGERLGMQLFEQIAKIIDGLGECEIRVTRSQVSFRHVRTFALVWRPSMYVASNVPVVLSIAVPIPIRSTRFKQVVHPAPTTWMDHLELRHPADIDDEVRAGWPLPGALAALLLPIEPRPWSLSSQPRLGLGPMTHHGATVRTARDSL